MLAQPYSTAIREISSLSDTEIEAIVALYLQYYDGSNRSMVIADLTKKTHILILVHEGVMVGFTTFEHYDRMWNGTLICVIYSGDTIVHHKHWGQQALAFGWIRFIGTLKRLAPFKPIYWFLIVKGHRTYKYLPAFTKSFYPHWAIDRSDLKPLLNFLAEEKFGRFYNKTTGIIAYDTSRGHLKGDFVLPSQNEMMKPSVQFFVKSNPKYGEGDELACICDFEDTNLKPFTKRIVHEK